ncbi:serine kinase [Dickeya zeae]|uniref:serine kinase n=1 Tax=Dickeya zeae TaxID=204042 RepID=UPI001CFAD0DE|nr:serine kinase [Dickeya zeae]UCZ75058.1 serine kinase [Dickeya zeae]
MNNMPGDHDVLRWNQWWCYGCLQQADPSWFDASCFDESDMALASVHHTAIRHHLGLAEAYPPEPQNALLQLGQLEAMARHQVLVLIATVCREASGELPQALAVWCRRLAKALRPGLWLPPSLTFAQHREQDALVILHHRFPASCRGRLQLLYPRDWRDCAQEQLSKDLPASRITSLCDAIIWKVVTTQASVAR